MIKQNIAELVEAEDRATVISELVNCVNSLVSISLIHLKKRF